MSKIIREPASAAKETYDLIIVGGGIHGAMLSLEATRRGLRSLLMERNDFGGATSFNSLRIIHGGLRYLQSLDLHRFRESVAERRWFLRTFPSLVKPLPCLMPLYGDGLRQPFIFRIALWLNDLLSQRRNRGVPLEQHLPPGRLIDVNHTREIFPFVDMQGLLGGAIWYDAFIPHSQRLIMEILRWACEYGATVLNYVEACQLLKTRKGVAGVMALDHEGGEYHEYKARVVVNAAGPWCRNVALSFDLDGPTLFRSSIGWNVLLDRRAVSDHAAAVTPKRPGGQTYFLVPWNGMLLAGTEHAPWLGCENRPMPSNEQLQEFLNNLNLAVPALELDQNDILYVFAGLLPVTKVGGVDLCTREVIFNHANHGGPRGLYSISGVKFTTARLVAEKTLKRIYPENKAGKDIDTTSFKPPEDAQGDRGIFHFHWRPAAEESEWKAVLRSLVEEEAVQHLDDLILRRTTLWENPSRAFEIVPNICKLFDWNDSRCHEEVKRLTRKLENGKIVRHNLRLHHVEGQIFGSGH